jgi:hypothetical protein
MPTLKIATTRPSLESKFWMEEVYQVGQTGTQETYNALLNFMGAGFVTSYYDELIPDSEIQARESEIKGDLKSIFLLPREEWSDNISPKVDTVPEDLVPWCRWGFHYQPPYNPFVLTWTFYMVFDTIEHLQQFRNRPDIVVMYEDMVLPAVAKTNNTIKFYVDGVES